MRGGVDELMEWFDRGDLVRPGGGVPSTVDLMQAIGSICGATEAQSEASRDVLARIGTPKHLIFALIDGLGMSLLEHLKEGEFLKRQVARSIHAVFPSTTASALTSIATAAWPTDHAIVGWWTRVPEKDLTATVLPYRERFSGKLLSDLGVTSEALYPTAPILPQFDRRVRTFTPERYADSVFTQYSTGGTPVHAFSRLETAAAEIVERIEAAARPTYTYLYFDEVDGMSHQHGPNSVVVGEAVRRVNKVLSKLAASIRGRATLVVSADHGHIDVADHYRHRFESTDPIFDCLVDPPAGEPRVPMFRLVEGADDSFVEQFRDRFDGTFTLLSIDEIDDLRLFGPEPLSNMARSRIGDYVAIARDKDVFVYYGPGRPSPPMRGYHGGLTATEMEIPLIVA